jgi:hypothetical protein
VAVILDVGDMITEGARRFWTERGGSENPGANRRTPDLSFDILPKE